MTGFAAILGDSHHKRSGDYFGKISVETLHIVDGQGLRPKRGEVLQSKGGKPQRNFAIPIA